MCLSAAERCVTGEGGGTHGRKVGPHWESVCLAQDVIDAILADTNELQTDDTPGALTALDAKIDTIDANVDAVLADTNELQSDWVILVNLPEKQ